MSAMNSLHRFIKAQSRQKNSPKQKPKLITPTLSARNSRLITAVSLLNGLTETVMLLCVTLPLRTVTVFRYSELKKPILFVLLLNFPKIKNLIHLFGRGNRKQRHRPLTCTLIFQCQTDTPLISRISNLRRLVKRLASVEILKLSVC